MEQKSTGSPPIELLNAPGFRYLTLHDVSNDGRFVVCRRGTDDVLVFDREQEASESNPFAFVHASASDFGAAFSPDGRWLAYVSYETGLDHVYVRNFPDGDLKQIVSQGRGVCPMWSPDGREIFYQREGVRDAESGMWEFGSTMMAVPVETTPKLRLGEPRQLVKGPFWSWCDGGAGSYDVSTDGSRFLMVGPEDDPFSTRELMVVLNWFEELKRLVPTE